MAGQWPDSPARPNVHLVYGPPRGQTNISILFEKRLLGAIRKAAPWSYPPPGQGDTVSKVECRGRTASAGVGDGKDGGRGWRFKRRRHAVP
jgi:hypothetical protein